MPTCLLLIASLWLNASWLALQPLPPLSGAKVPPARAVVIADTYELTPYGAGAYTLDRRKHVVVKDAEMAERFRMLSAYYDETSSVEVLEGSLMAPGMKKPRRSKRNEVVEVANNDGFSIALSGAHKLLRLPIPQAYPATYTFHSRINVKEDVWLPTISFDYGPFVEIESASLIILGATQKVRHHVVDAAGLILQESEPNRQVFRVANLPAYQKEDYVPKLLERGPAIMLSPTTGQLDGISGEFSSWAGIGRWNATLLQDRNTLPPEAIAEVQALVADLDDPFERIRAVYQYMQARTHYVSIQLGIGGLKPMDPQEVHENGYGDCKALSNYTRLLLEAVDIESNYCVIGAGDREILYPEFPSFSQANHVVLAVPLAADTVWLECTSQLAPANYQSSWTAGRYALMLKGETGELVKTHASTPADNQIRSQTTITIQADGHAQLKRVGTYTGITAETPYYFNQADPDEREKYGRVVLDRSAQNVVVHADMTYKGLDPVGTLTVTAELPNYVRKLAGRLVFPAYGHTTYELGPQDTAHRQRAVHIPDSYTRVDTLRFVLPEDANLKVIPKPKAISGPHATYELRASATAEGLSFVRTFRQQAGLYPPETAADMAKFYRAIREADNSVVSTSPKPNQQP